MERTSFKKQTFKLREDAIVGTANRLLASKGYDAMTMDDVAAAVGVSKGLLYKHFPSKESLAAAAMVRLLDAALEYLGSLPSTMPAIDKLRASLAWALRTRADGSLPLLPSTNPALQQHLLGQGDYVSRLWRLNVLASGLVSEAQRAGDLRDDLPAEVLLHVFYARTCDPAFDFLRETGHYATETLIGHLVAACFGGLGRQAPVT
jgi:AcrR family transcriptional regulator